MFYSTDCQSRFPSHGYTSIEIRLKVVLYEVRCYSTLLLKETLWVVCVAYNMHAYLYVFAIYPYTCIYLQVVFVNPVRK